MLIHACVPHRFPFICHSKTQSISKGSCLQQSLEHEVHTKVGAKRKNPLRNSKGISHCLLKFNMRRFFGKGEVVNYLPACLLKHLDRAGN